MDDDNDSLDNISELKLLESLDLGHRKVFKEEEKQKENDEFVENINLLLSKLNERINIIKNLPKLEIKPFDLESNKSNKSNKPKDQNQIQNSNNLPNNNMNNKLSNLSNTNNFANNTFNTPYPIEGSIDYNIKNKKKYVIPDSFNEKNNAKLNKLNNNNNFKENNNNNIISENNNINNDIPGENYIEGESNEIKSIEILSNDNKKETKSEKGNLEEGSGINLKENPKDNKNDNNNSIGEIKNENIKNNIPNNNKNNPEIEINDNNLEDIVSIEDDFPSLSEHNDKVPEINNNTKNQSKTKEVIESMNYINSNIKNEDEESNINRKNEEERKSKTSGLNLEEKIQEKEIREGKNENENKDNFKLTVDEIEIFDENENQNNENSERNNLRNKINNKEIKEKEPRDLEISERKEDEKDQKDDQKFIQKNNKKEKEEDKEEDQYDKEFNKLNNFDINKLKSVVTNNDDTNTQPRVNINTEKDDEIKEMDSKEEENKSEKKENEAKNNLKERMIKNNEDSDEIESLGEKKEETKKEDSVGIESLGQKKEETKKEASVGVESLGEKKEETKKEPSVEIETMNPQKEDKKEEVMEIKDDDEISEQQDENNENKPPEKEPETSKEDKNNKKEQTKINESSKINKEEDEEINQNNNIKQSILNKINTMPQINLNHPVIKKPYKKSYTQKGDILIQIRQTYTRTEKDESSPDISNIDEYPTLKNINSEEKALDEIVSEFDELILKNEKKEVIETKKNFLIKKKHIQLNIQEGQDYSQFFGDLKVSHPELMQKNYNEEKLKSTLKRRPDFEEKIFNKLFFDEINSPIGPVENIETFSQKYNLEKEDIKQYFDSNFKKWRKILGDGNSFYRIIMFSLLEAYIFNKTLEELKFLLYDIMEEENIIIYEEKKIDVEVCSNILAEILFLIENENAIKAYEILVKAYSLKDGSFDKLLITYIRHLLAIYTENAKELLSDEEKKNIIKTNIFNSYYIESSNIEPTFLNICCFPYLFDVKINLIYLQGDLDSPEQRSINLVGEEGDYPYINIGFFYSSYHKLYPTNFELNYNCTLPMPKTIRTFSTLILKEFRPCEECKSEREHILFLEKKFIVCKNCLEFFLSKICNFRSDSFEKDGFFGVEYYTRPIKLQGSYYIDDYEIIELLDNNILATLISKYAGIVCESCHKKDENIIELKCGCGFCKKCLTDKFLNITKGLRVLNDFEKKQLKNTKCSCGKAFDIDTCLKFINKNEKDKIDALERLKKYVQTLCLLCNKELREEGTKEGDFKDVDEDVNYKKIKIKKMNGEGPEAEIYESDHFICDECYSHYLKRKIEINDDDDENEEETKDGVIDTEKATINCSICCRKHLFRITQNEACCANGCTIY